MLLWEKLQIHKKFEEKNMKVKPEPEMKEKPKVSSKTTKLTETAYLILLKKQVDLLEKGIGITIQDLAEKSICKGLELIGEDDCAIKRSEYNGR
ncbi:MAG: hypothetical protein A2W22_02460 [Candidatus Levybacteria bacterium RBG_16_35_11]|nr:MAG: hypothetical protein A2W22_02460 [Candidatus Levybacteria bacterium RBG_16_35_11]